MARTLTLRREAGGRAETRGTPSVAELDTVAHWLDSHAVTDAAW